MAEHNEFGWAYKVILNDINTCGCGSFEDRIKLIKEVLEAMPLHTPKKQLDYLKTPLGEFFLDVLTNADLIEHGSSMHGSWITPKGERFLKSLEDLDKLEEYIDHNGYCECETCRKERKK